MICFFFLPQNVDRTISEKELIEMCKAPCYVEMQRSNLCYKYEYVRPSELFGKRNKQLTEYERGILNKKMVGEWFDFHCKYIDHDRYMRRQKARRHERRVAFFRERYEKRKAHKMKLLRRVPDDHANDFVREDADDESLSSTLYETFAEQLNRRIDMLFDDMPAPAPTVEDINEVNVSSSTDGNDDFNDTYNEVIPPHDDLPQINIETEDETDDDFESLNMPDADWAGPASQAEDSDDDNLVIDDTVVERPIEMEVQSVSDAEDVKNEIFSVGSQPSVQSVGIYQNFNISSDSDSQVIERPIRSKETQSEELFKDLGAIVLVDEIEHLGAVMEVTTTTFNNSWPASQSTQQRSLGSYNEFEVHEVVTSTQDAMEAPDN